MARKRDWATLALALPGARKARLPNQPFAPALAKLGDAPPSGEGWLHELKWDGYRLVGTLVDGSARLWSRNALEWTDKQPRLANALEKLGARSLAVDGELIAGQGTQADFNLLQTTLSGESKGSLTLVLFDLVHIDGADLSAVPLLERKDLLAQLLDKPPPGLSYSSHVVGNGAQAFDTAAKAGFEGIISKRVGSPYRGGRGDDWRKTKHLPSDEFAVVGWMPGKGSRVGVGSLLLAKPDGDGWRYVGRVGTGFTDELLRTLNKRIAGKASSTPTAQVPAGKVRDLKEARWLAPSFVAEVFIRGVSNQGVLRQPSLKALRLDKRPADLADSDRG